MTLPEAVTAGILHYLKYRIRPSEALTADILAYYPILIYHIERKKRTPETNKFVSGVRQGFKEPRFNEEPSSQGI